MKLAVLGASGRMGDAVLTAATERAGTTVVSALDRPGTDAIGTRLASGVEVTADLDAGLAKANVYIDFTTPAATTLAARAALPGKVAAVIGTTGLDDDAREAIDALAAVAPVIVAPNFSLGVNVLLHLAESAARALGPDFDLEVVEAHHRRKRDAPSGTALALGQALAAGRGVDFETSAVLSRAGDVGPRRDGEIGFATVRGGDIVGEHTAMLISDDERIEISHRAQSRTLFARGALVAAAFIADKGPGHYTMSDVLGLARA